MKKWIIGIIVLGVVGWAIFDFASSDDAPENLSPSDSVGLDRGDKAPGFTIETLEGEEVKLADYQGQKVLLNFWATWCPPCRAEMPDMQKFYENDAGDDIAILGVNLISEEQSMTGVKDFLDEYEISFPILVDDASSVAYLYKAHSLPTSYLINKDGTIHDVAVGPLNYELMVQKFAEMD